MRDAAYEVFRIGVEGSCISVGNVILGASGTDHGEHAELLIDALLPRGDDDQAFQYSEIAAKRAEAAYWNIEASLFSTSDRRRPPPRPDR